MKHPVLLITLLTGGLTPGATQARADIQPPATRRAEPAPAARPTPAAATVTSATTTAATNGTEPAPTLNTSSLLEAEWLQGPAHRVRATAPTDGYMAHFTIDSDFGTFHCTGVDQTRQRVHEIGAISRLVSESKGDVFAAAVRKSIEQPVDAVKNIVRDPAGTVGQAPKAVGHFFRRLGSSIKAGAEQIANNADTTEDESSPPRARTGEQLAAAGRGVIGFDKSKLDCARQLGVDPYSDNPVLQEQLEKVAWVYFAGGLPLRLGAAAASGGASLALTSTKLIGLPDEVYSLTPSELALRNRESLVTLDTPEPVQADFMAHRRLTPTLKRSLLQSLERLAPATGRSALVELATQCESIEQAQFLDRSLRLLAERQYTGQARYTRVVSLGRVPAAVTAEGGLDVPAVIDYLSWTEEVADFARRDDLRSAQPTLVLTGQASAQAIAGFKHAGWTLARP